MSLSGVCVTAVESRPAGVTRDEQQSQRAGQRPFGARVKAFVALTKPRIIELLLITTVPVMFLAEQGVPTCGWCSLTCIGGYLSAGGANALNMYIDRDIDALMDRTSQRPLVTGMVSPRECLVFGITLAVVSTLCSASLVNWLSAWLSLGALLFYVVVYTMILKRRTSQNIVWGGIAGCMPVLIGWSAVTNSMSWAPVILFLVIFFWTPPHYWPLSMKVKDDYARVGVPMLPVVASNKVVARQIVALQLGDGRGLPAADPARLHGLVLHGGRPGWPAAGGCGRRTRCRTARRRRRRAASSRRCGCSTGRSPTCRCCSWRWRWTPSCAESFGRGWFVARRASTRRAARRPRP